MVLERPCLHVQAFVAKLKKLLYIVRKCMLATAPADPLDALRLARAVAWQAVMAKFGQICIVGAALTHMTGISISI